MWELYNELIKEVPINITVDEVIYGPRFVMVRSGDRIGVAMNTSGTSIPPIIKESPIGKSLRKCMRIYSALYGLGIYNRFNYYK